MAKLSIAEEDIQEVVDEVASEYGLAQVGIDFQALVTSKAKEAVTVVKANQCAEVVSNREDLVFVIVYADAWDVVDDKTRKMWVRMEMDKVSYDSEKEKITIGCPTITIPVGFYEMHKTEAVDAALLAQYTIASIEQTKKEEAEAKKAAKKKKKG